MMAKRKLVISLTTIILALTVSSISMSLAWYSTGNKLQVENVDISFKGDRELKLATSLEGEYKETLENSDLKVVDTFYPVSSMYSSKWLDKKSKFPVFKDNYYLASISNPNSYKESKDAKAGFYSQELFIKSDHDVYITLDPSLFNIVADEEKNAEKVKEIRNDFLDKTDQEILDSLNTIKDSLRVSLLIDSDESYEYYIIDPYKQADTYFAGTLDNTQSGYYDYYLDYNTLKKYEFVYGEYQNEDKIVYDEALNTDSSLLYPTKELSAFNARTKSGINKFNLSKSLANGFTPAKETSITPLEASKKIEIPLRALEAKRLVISIYLEGWDLDNTNISMYGSFIASMKFKIAKEMI